VDNNLIALRSFFNWCLSRGEISSNPIAQQRHGERVFFDERIDRKEAYTRDEVGRILRAASGDDRRVARLLASWGLRISELVMLEWSDIDFEGGWMHVRNKVTHDGVRYCPKDKTDRKIPLEGQRVLTVLEELAIRTGQQGYILPLPQVKSRRDYAERRLLERLKRLAQTTGVPRKKLTLHRFRHYFVSECADCGVPMATTMEWVGHNELKMVLYYYSLRDESARKAMRRFTERDEPAGDTREDQGRPTGDAGKSEYAATDGAGQDPSPPASDQTDTSGDALPAASARSSQAERTPAPAGGATGSHSKLGGHRAGSKRRAS
jgi:integrase